MSEQQEVKTPGVGTVLDEIDAFVPEGYKDGDDIFSGDGRNDDDIFADGQEVDDILKLLGEAGDTTPAAPTKDEPGAVSNAEAEAGNDADATDGTQAEPQKTSRTLTLKVNHQTEQVDVNALGDDELTAMLQKSRAYDLMKEKEKEQKYRDTYQEQVDAGMTEAAARMIARDVAGGTYSLADEGEDPAPETPASAPETAADSTAELTQLQTLLGLMGQKIPEKMPDEVALAHAHGMPLTTAYIAYQQKQMAAEKAALQKENNILKQNAARAARAPVKGVSGGDSSPEKAKSIFEQGFDAGALW